MKRPVHLKPPKHNTKAITADKSVFLAGSIEMGAAKEWQVPTANVFNKAGISVFNPRRDDWDSSWEQDISNENFKNQVEWEISHMDLADVIFFYFDPETKSPITLMELGLHAENKVSIVCCPKGYWRRGNIQVLCNWYNIPLFEDIDLAIEETIKHFRMSR